MKNTSIHYYGSMLKGLHFPKSDQILFYGKYCGINKTPQVIQNELDKTP